MQHPLDETLDQIVEGLKVCQKNDVPLRTIIQTTMEATIEFLSIQSENKTFNALEFTIALQTAFKNSAKNNGFELPIYDGK